MVAQQLLRISSRLHRLQGRIHPLACKELVEEPEWLETLYNIGMPDQLEYDPIEVQCGAVAALARHQERVAGSEHQDRVLGLGRARPSTWHAVGQDIRGLYCLKRVRASAKTQPGGETYRNPTPKKFCLIFSRPGKKELGAWGGAGGGDSNATQDSASLPQGLTPGHRHNP